MARMPFLLVTIIESSHMAVIPMMFSASILSLHSSVSRSCIEPFSSVPLADGMPEGGGGER